MSDLNTYLQPNSRPAVPPTSDEKTLAMLTHLLTFVSSIIAPLIIYLVKKDDSPFVAGHAKAALNFQLSLLIYGIISAILMIILIGFILLWVIGICALVFTIIAAIAAFDGKEYQYPFTIQFIK